MNSPPALEPGLLSDAAVFRQFNRIYTRFIGTLDEGLLHTEYSLAEARVLYELATCKSPSARQIAAELGIDAGYLSRILTKFERAGLLKRKASAHDARSAEISLSPAGKSAFKNLDALANAQADVLLRGLAHANRTELIRSMRAIEGILAEPKAVRQSFILRSPRPGDMGWVVSREGAVYHEEYGWDQTFEALVARIVSDFVTNFNPLRERCWIADVNGQSAGHIFLVQHRDRTRTAKLRLLFVEPSARGLGLGNALVKECIQFARAAGYRRIVLWTQSILVAAHGIYQSAGFRLMEEKRHHSFGKDLLGQTWELKFK